MAAVPPFVSYASLAEARIAPQKWPEVYASLQALKAHVQEYPGCQRLEVFVAVEDDGAVRAQCYTTWDTPEQLDVYLERGYTFERMLGDCDCGEVDRSLVMEKLF
jgi:quinol monooxygenase YgiN